MLLPNVQKGAHYDTQNSRIKTKRVFASNRFLDGGMLIPSP